MMDFPSRVSSFIKRVDLALRPDVDPAGGLVEDQDLAVADQPFRDHDLLLVTARKVPQELLEGGRPDVQPPRVVVR